MHADTLILLIAVVFASQILVLSFITPFKWQQDYLVMFKKHPPESFPRLYPVPNEAIERRLATFRRLALAVGIGSGVAVIGALFYATRPVTVWRCMILCLIAQSAPWCIALVLDAQVKRAFRAIPAPVIRSVELRRWSLTDFVPPMSIGLGFAAQASTLACAVLMRVYHPNAANIVFFGISSGAWLLLMTRLVFRHAVFFRTDPYMTSADTFHARQRLYRRLFLFGTLYGAFGAFSLLVTAHVLHVRLAYFAIGASVFFQLRAIAAISDRRRELKCRDFSVYRADSPTPTVL
jgi:hypothetical protein